jgi:hypothetical protein
MMRRKIFVFVLLLGILVLTTDVLALEPGDHFGFYDKVVLPGANTWEHSLDNDVFIPDLNDNEPLIIEHALLLLSLNFNPNTIGRFKACVKLDGESLGIIDYHFSNNFVKNRLWWKSITNPDVLDLIADRPAEIKINVLKGTLNYVRHSVLLGSGVVAPEPISMALVGAGLAGLPIAVRFRRLLRK